MGGGEGGGGLEVVEQMQVTRCTICGLSVFVGKLPEH